MAGWPASGTGALQQVWQRVQAHPFETPGDALDFTRRLARDHNWTLAFARGAVAEYRRFCFLAVSGPGHPATPSEEVDEVWHAHLLYTRDYWDQWCAALGAPLHHDPTRGGPGEGQRFRRQYAETLARYEALWGTPPPAYWPAAHVRFGAAPRYRTVDAGTARTLPRVRGWVRDLWRRVG